MSDELEKLVENAILAWANQEHLEPENVTRDELHPAFVSHLAALLRTEVANARRETLETAAKIVEAHDKHPNYFDGTLKSCIQEAAKEIRAEAEKERVP